MNKFFILFFLLISYSQSQLTDEERKKLLKKVTKQVSIESLFRPLNAENPINIKSTYQQSKIKDIIKKYKFPESYNYLEENKITPIVKDQKNCGSCWSFASTTALSYRFHKKGIDVNLSPQYSLSCSNRDCTAGDYLIDSQFHLVKNGTVTEDCMPYSSGSGNNYNIEQCPTKCKNGNNIVKYYSKNAYTTVYSYSEDNYYDIVTVIMDQLINFGPVHSQIRVYQDFYKLNSYKYCSNVIYKYDKSSTYSGGHAVVIVGYGFKDNKYYWIIQNSWGDDFCDKGFAKIEFQEIGIECVSFSQPYIEDNSRKKDISIKISRINEYCNLFFSSSNKENYFDIIFKKDSSNLYFQCGSNPEDDNEGICSMSQRSLSSMKGIYKISEYNTLLNLDKYTIDFSSISGKINFYGYNSYGMGSSTIYVSEAGSTITLYYYPNEGDVLDKFYPNINAISPLSNCKEETYIGSKMMVVICKIQSSELSYFSNSVSLPLVYDALCGLKVETSSSVGLLNKNKYPVYRIKKLLLDNEIGYIDKNNLIILLANIEGSVPYPNDSYLFEANLKISYNNKIYYAIMYCLIQEPMKAQKNFLIYCLTQDNNKYRYDEVYLRQFYFIDLIYEPFEILIQKDIKGTKVDFNNLYDLDALDDEDIYSFRRANCLKLDINHNILILFLLLLF